MTAARPPRLRALTACLALAVPLLCSPTAPARAASEAVLAEDGFDRTVAQGLGSAPAGGTWTIPTGASTVQVGGSVARFAGRPGQVLDARLSQGRARDVSVLETLVLPELGAGGHTMAGLNARIDAATGTGYRLWANLSADGSVVLHANRVSPTGDSVLGTGVRIDGLVAQGRRIKLRLQVSGTETVTLRGTVWADGSAEPAPQFSAADSSTARLTDAGQVGLALVAGSTTTPVTVTHFTALTTSPQAPAPTSPPEAPAPTTPQEPAPDQGQPAPQAAVAARGSLPVGQASYPVPSGAVFMATNGNDANPGSQAAPVRSLARAVELAPSGGTVVVRGGSYHQGEVGIFKPLTVQAHPGEAVWFDGSTRITQWTRSGDTWSAPWTARFDHSTSYTVGGRDDSFLDPKYPLAAWPDQLFVDGQQLQQVAPGSVGAGQFAVDYANQRIIMGTDPSGREVRGSDLDRVFTVGSPDVTLRGFGIRRYANAIPRMGVIFMARQRNLVENVVIHDVASTGISMTSDGRNGAGTVNRVTIERSGLMGIGGANFDGGKVTNSVIRNNNTQRFTPLPATAGVKVTASRNVTFDNNLLEDNYNTNGLWTDESVIGVTVTRNRITNAAQDGFAGIQLELTSSAVVADNVVSGQVRGLYLFDSEHLRVSNNTIWNSRIADISVDQDFRRQSNPAHNGHDPRNPVPDASNTWVSRDIAVRNNLFGTDANFSNFQFYVLDKDKALTAGSMVATATGNAFEAKDANSPTLIGWGRNDGRVDMYNDLSAWSGAVGRGWVNRTYPAGASVQQAQQAASAMTHGSPLEADIAQKIGQAAGSTHIGAFQQV
ncbi:right-handed parallel beta-helix repeat-containing protein [Luteococcus peritonei]|uniref:Right-handed parallel beta-helix repeat-containing protein n=1 Tax=Luteococcus peritonei TaxID=88874 RepID=A0ABW4RSQ6_9ACTN